MKVEHAGRYRKRTYRERTLKEDFNTYTVTIQESDLFIGSDLDLTDVVRSSLYKYRAHIESYIGLHPEFLTSLIPLKYDEFAPEIVRDMMLAARKANVGPMAAVAGAVAEYVGTDLLGYSKNVIIENGGDIYINSQHDIHVGIFAGNSPLSNRISLLVKKTEMPMGVCTSSGTIGHSLSFGRADAVCVKAKSTTLADAAATAIANRIKTRKDIPDTLTKGMEIDNVLGIIIIVDDQIGAIGEIELCHQ